MKVIVQAQFLSMEWQTGNETCLVIGSGGPYTLEELKEAAEALQHMIEAMEADKFSREYDAATEAKPVHTWNGMKIAEHSEPETVLLSKKGSSLG